MKRLAIAVSLIIAFCGGYAVHDMQQYRVFGDITGFHGITTTTYLGYREWSGGYAGSYLINVVGGGGGGRCGSIAKRCTCGFDDQKEFGDFLPSVADLPHEIRIDKLAKRGERLMVAC